MMGTWRDLFVGSVLKWGFESSTSGGTLRGPTIRLLVAGDAYMPATIAVGRAFSIATLPDNQRNMTPPAGIDVACIGTVKVSSQSCLGATHAN